MSEATDGFVGYFNLVCGSVFTPSTSQVHGMCRPNIHSTPQWVSNAFLMFPVHSVD